MALDGQHEVATLSIVFPLLPVTLQHTTRTPNFQGTHNTFQSMVARNVSSDNLRLVEGVLFEVVRKRFQRMRRTKPRARAKDRRCVIARRSDLKRSIGSQR